MIIEKTIIDHREDHHNFADIEAQAQEPRSNVHFFKIDDHLMRLRTTIQDALDSNGFVEAGWARGKNDSERSYSPGAQIIKRNVMFAQYLSIQCVLSNFCFFRNESGLPSFNRESGNWDDKYGEVGNKFWQFFGIALAQIWM